MAKSLFEPKKIPSYTENLLKPNTGLQAAPVPARQQSATRVVPKTQAIPAEAQQVSAPAPAPIAPVAPVPTAPPAPAVESQGFLFDGATELSGSFLSSVTPELGYFTLNTTVTPTWSQSDTGSFAIFAVGTSGSNDYRVQLFLERTSGSFGYRDRLVSQRFSGSNSITVKRPLKNSPNIYSGSISNFFLSVYMNTYGIQYVRENGEASPMAPQEYSVVGTESSVYTLASIQKIYAASHSLSIGGLNSGSDHYFQGRIDNFAVGYGSNYMGYNKSAKDYTNANNMTVYYRFEGNVSATKGDNLTVIGTSQFENS